MQGITEFIEQVKKLGFCVTYTTTWHVSAKSQTHALSNLGHQNLLQKPFSRQAPRHTHKDFRLNSPPLLGAAQHENCIRQGALFANKTVQLVSHNSRSNQQLVDARLIPILALGYQLISRFECAVENVGI